MARPTVAAAAAVAALVLAAAALPGAAAQPLEQLDPYIPSCSSYTQGDFKQKFLSRGVEFNLSNAGDYVYNVSAAGVLGDRREMGTAVMQGSYQLPPSCPRAARPPFVRAASGAEPDSGAGAGRAEPAVLPALPHLDVCLLLLLLLRGLLPLLPQAGAQA